MIIPLIEKLLVAVDEQLVHLQAAREALVVLLAPPPTEGSQQARKTRVLSAAARRKISLAQKARWVAKKRAGR